MEGFALHAGYSAFGGYVDPVFLPELLWTAADMREGFIGMETTALKEFLFLEFRGEQALKKCEPKGLQHNT